MLASVVRPQMVRRGPATVWHRHVSRRQVYQQGRKNHLGRSRLDHMVQELDQYRGVLVGGMDVFDFLKEYRKYSIDNNVIIKINTKCVLFGILNTIGVLLI